MQLDLFNPAPAPVPAPVLVPSIEQQTGWRRPGAQAVCQDWVVLERVTQFSYELTDAFMDYTRARMGIDLRLKEYPQGCPEIMARHDAGGWARTQALFSRQARPVERWMRNMQQRLQDLWELFVQNGPLPLSAPSLS